jgi:hypothetical protein
VSARVRTALVALCLAAGCLPAGDPPRGQHLLDGRDDLSAQFQPTGAGNPTRLLTFTETTHPKGYVGTFGLSVHDVGPIDPATGQARRTLLLDDVVYGGSGGGCDPCGYAYDARGRLFMGRADDTAVGFQVRLWRVDPATAKRDEIGLVDGSALSADRTRLLFSRIFTVIDDPWRVRDLDDVETTVPNAVKADMLGNDVYFTSPDDKLFRLPSTALDATPELLAENVAEFQRIDTARGSLLLLSARVDEPYGPTLHRLFDPAVGKAIPLPGETAPQANPYLSPSLSGRYLLISGVIGRAGLSMTMFDRDTGASHQETLDAGVFGTFWRPGHEEAWLQTDGGVLRWPVGEAPARMSGVNGVLSGVRPSGSIFTPDGAWFLAYGAIASLRSADDLAAPPLPLNAQGMTFGNYWPLADGRGITEAYKTYQFHDDITLVDPTARTQRLLGSGGYVVAVGAHRALVFLSYVKSTMSGTLTLIDLDTGSRTVLGEDVHDVTIDASPSPTDRLAPGTHVAFLVRSRIAGPYDGLWLAELP